MEKLAYSKFQTLTDLTKSGMNLFLHLVFLSDEAGNVIRYSYQSAREELGMIHRAIITPEMNWRRKGTYVSI